METWLIILFSLGIAALFRPFFNLLFTPKKTGHNLPPGPPTFPIIGNFLWLAKSFSEIEPILRDLHKKFGPIVTLRLGSKPAIFVTDRSLIYQALVQNGAVFADRPPPLATAAKIDSANQHTINTAAYGPTWRTLRRNLTAEILSRSRVKSYSTARKWVLQILKEQLKSKAAGDAPVLVVNHLRYAMFCLLVLMCFGDKLDEKQIKNIEDVQRQLLLNFESFSILNFWPSVTRVLFYKRWNNFLQIRQNQEDIIIPLIRARKKVEHEELSKSKEDKQRTDQEQEHILSYVDTLLDLQLPEEKRKLDEREMVSLCSEFLNAGTDTTSTAFQWIMANLVKYPQIQEKLFMEIKGVVGEGKEEISEDDIQNMPYLKAVILEGLRRHPPGHFVLPHSVTEDVVLNGFLVPKDGTINFMIVEMGWDSKVWQDPMAFKPERFLIENDEEVFDITGSKEIKMIPFGAGRRICPGYGLAMLHLEYFLANLVWSFEWKAVKGDEVDLSEKQEFTVGMKHPLQANIYPRKR